MTPIAQEHDLHETLRKYWGYEAFRPLQERIVQSILAGRDVAAVMPTGGGKSLCYQLPPVVAGWTAVVISPLIALMQDQVVQLGQMGIPSAAVNSAMPYPEQRAIMQRAARGEFRLLYLSPERLSREDTIEFLRSVPVGLFAIDEAHCISEWGHEFRPEYRQLGILRQHFPEVPIAAFTASATKQVRHDILAQLQLLKADRYIKSFYRENLRYFVKECKAKDQWQLLIRALRSYKGENVIVYASTIALVEETARSLQSNGIGALPYHGQMKPEERKRNQEAWMNGDSPVMVGTLAFGLGINKGNVRAVIHLSLPKSIEQYYQEAGRAGRDGEPADCLLLWTKKDLAVLAYFINQVEDQAEKTRAWRRYHDIKTFATDDVCRHLQFCTHFGETPKWPKCGHCDVCGWKPASIEPKKKAKPAMPLPEQRPAATLTIERDVEEPEVVMISDEERAFRDLVDRMKEWRKNLAREWQMPAFVILTDASLEDLCRKRPTNLKELRNVQGIGEYKANSIGELVLRALNGDVNVSSESVGPKPQPPDPQPRKVPSSADRVLTLVEEGLRPDEMIGRLGVAPTTIQNYLAGLIEAGRLTLPANWVTPDRRARIEAAAQQAGLTRLKPIRELLGEDYPYDEISLVVAALRAAANRK